VTENQANINGDWHDVMWKIVTRVEEYTAGRLLWIAGQDDDEFDDLYGFVIVDIPGRERGKDGGFACIRLADARTADDAVIRKLATDVLGYEPGSLKDLETRKYVAEITISAIRERIAMDQRNLEYYQAKLAEIEKLETQVN
jgi:hypothetical protein